MPKLPSVTGKEAIAAFEKADFVVDRVAGSHHIMRKEDHPFVLSVPVHKNQKIKRGTLRSLIRAADLSVDEFILLLNE
jgi:predicted RNA binding protein YcfA (HicA-like mRNA interferase family)